MHSRLSMIINMVLLMWMLMNVCVCVCVCGCGCLCLCVCVQMLIPFAFIKFDPETEEPVRDSAGLCMEVAPGKTIMKAFNQK